MQLIYRRIAVPNQSPVIKTVIFEIQTIINTTIVTLKIRFALGVKAYSLLKVKAKHIKKNKTPVRKPITKQPIQSSRI